MVIEEDESKLVSIYTNLAFEDYKSSRTEIIERIKQRDQIISYYFTALAFIYGAGATLLTKSNINNDYSILNVILFVLWLVSVLISVSLCLKVVDHDFTIGLLSEHCKKLTNRIGLKNFEIWDNSSLLKIDGKKISYIILLSNLILFSIPSIIGFSYSLLSQINGYYIIIIISFIFFLINLYFLFRVMKKRIFLFENINDNKEIITYEKK